MAESLAALGVAANIVQFLELGFKVTKSIIETYRNIDTEGLAARHVDLSSITTSLKDRCTQLQSDAGVRADAITMELLRRCIKIANELLSQLESLTIAAGKRDPRWAKFVVSVKANWKKSAIEGLHSRMMDVKTEIFGRLEGLIQNTRVSMSTSEMMLSLGEASAAWNDATRRRLDAMAKELRDLLHSGSEVHSVQMLSFAGSLSRFADESKKQGAIRDILLSLKFTQIKERQNEILQAHKDTFEWMFDESSRVNFCSWLEKPSGGVFWITGKPGSGKSTLMKLILNHPKTLPLARKWSGSKPLVIASHFFWSVGSRLQRSQEGLLRTLLFQILVHCPEIIPRVCSRRYLNPFLALDTWSIEELSESFDKLRSFDELPRRVLLLVDGLDEYIGDHEALVVFLSAIARFSDIKVCCASRPWSQFSEAVGHGPWQFEMQHLTREDMRMFIEDNLGQNQRFRDLRMEQRESSERLIQTIFNKAEGVFFWVSLVVKSILRGLNNQDGFDILQQRLSQLPSDLYQFFQRMLDSVEDVYREEARLDFILLLSSSAPLPIDVFIALDLLPSIASDLPPSPSSSSKFRSKRHLLYNVELSSAWHPKNIERLSRGSRVIETLSREQKRDQVLARCRDLVQSWQVDGDDSTSIRIGFLHRTVVDFLRGSGSLQQFESQLRHSPRYFLSAALLFCSIDMEYISAEICVDFILRIVYCMEEAEPDELWRDGENLWITCERLYRCLSVVNAMTETGININGMELLIAQAMARLLMAQPSLRQGWASYPRMRYRKTLESYILEGNVTVEVGDYATWSTSDLIDLELLDGVIRCRGEYSEIEFNWAVFIARLDHGSRPGPRNIFQACQLLIRHGAKRHISIPSAAGYDHLLWAADSESAGWESAESESPHCEPTVRTGLSWKQVDVVFDVFQEKGIFDADQLDELAGLFQPEIEPTPDSEKDLYVSPVSRFWRLLSGVKDT